MKYIFGGDGCFGFADLGLDKEEKLCFSDGTGDIVPEKFAFYKNNAVFLSRNKTLYYKSFNQML